MKRRMNLKCIETCITGILRQIYSCYLSIREIRDKKSYKSK